MFKPNFKMCGLCQYSSHVCYNFTTCRLDVSLSAGSIIFQRPTFLSFTGITNFIPDQVSSTAHTFISTSPLANARFLITSYVISVITFDAFFGHEIQIIPFGSISFFSKRIVLIAAVPTFYFVFCQWLVKIFVKRFIQNLSLCLVQTAQQYRQKQLWQKKHHT